MMSGLVLSFTALVALLPATLLPYRRTSAHPGTVFWSVLCVAIAGAVVYCAVVLAGAWETGLATALWLSIVASLAVFAGLAAFSRAGWRLAPLLMPYLVILGSLATILSRQSAGAGLIGRTDAWLVAHILVSVATYALVTNAAVAGVAAFLQERAVKGKHPGRFSSLLPAVSEAERLQVRLLAISEVVLAAGILTGMSKLYSEEGAFLAFDHKTLLSLLAFALIACVLFLQQKSGLRGRRAAQVVLIAYLLLTLAYPGVKFVQFVLMT